MRALRKIGDTLLSKLVPETEARALTCTSGACPVRKETRCNGGLKQERCCYQAYGSACPRPYCEPWHTVGAC
ncbi:hypothetical protein GCM10010387_28100 [Streptomyces inusitatus]|uniref:Uncharacterized protein n=1 Tax=Streptomyces inusitatus TaxID=68221 RepID=A0A918Q5E9_9ACTN|nr:hypothetical protein [Streptomyces inusitatus]GGZ32443.1 hypothetical protein GCM10010387_28100 [Streptomyces inusitatus]